MRFKEENYSFILHEYLNIISHIANKSYQKSIWIEKKGPESQAFDDAVCDFFNMGDPILNEYKKFGISTSQFILLKNFSDAFEQFSDRNDLPQLFIDTPEWTLITLMAKEVLEAFNYGKI